MIKLSEFLPTSNINPKFTSLTYPFRFISCNSIKELYIPSSVTSIDRYAFHSTSLTDIYYNGTQADWNNIKTGAYNLALTSSNIHYNR